MGQDKPPRRVWDTLSRHMRRKTHGTEPQPPPPPEAKAQPPPAASYDEVMKTAPPAPQAKEEERGGAALPAWKTGGFKLTEEQAKRELDPKRQMARLLDYARERPLTASLVLLGAVGILAADAVLIARRLGLDDWLMINFDLGKDASRRYEVWERRGSGLALLAGPPGQEQEVTDPTQAAAVDGKGKLPEKPLEAPKLSGGLAGIITPEEIRSGLRASFVGGLDAAVLGDPKAARPQLSGMFVKTAKDDFRPYGAAGPAAEAAPAGVFFGEAGEALENFASISNAASAAAEYKDPDFAAIQEVPQGVSGDDLVLAMVGDDFKKEMKAYAKGGTWKLHKKDPAEKTVRHELEGMTLTGNNAVIQLLQTKRATDTGLKCGTCQTERRIHNTRAPFYGEEH